MDFAGCFPQSNETAVLLGSLILLLFNHLLKMLFDTPDCIYRYYLVVEKWKTHSIVGHGWLMGFAGCFPQSNSIQWNSSFAWLLILLIFNHFLKMLFDTPECIYHYYLVMENTQHWPRMACGFCGAVFRKTAQANETAVLLGPIILLLFNHFLKMLFDTRDCIYHYYLVEENT